MPAPVTFVVPGVRRESTTRGAPRGGRVSDWPGEGIGRRDHAARGAGGRRNASTQFRVKTPWSFTSPADPRCGCIPNTPASCCGAARPRARARRGMTRDRRRRGPRAARLQWRLEDAAPARGATRGFLGTCWFGRSTSSPASARTRRRGLRRVEGRRPLRFASDAGVYRARRETAGAAARTRRRRQSRDAKAPRWSWCTGRSAETSGTFGKLWTEHPQLVRRSVQRLRRSRLRARSPDARGKPDRQRDHARRSARRRGRACIC